VWGGDSIYADDYVKEATPEIITNMYHKQKQHPGYKRLLDTKIPILGVLDDHDYGVDNGDKTYRYRQESGVALACDFLDLKGSAICDRAQKGLGVYGVKVVDFDRPEGQELMTDREAGLDPDVTALDANAKPTLLSEKSVAIFLLDVRSNKTPYTKKGMFEKAEYDGDFLGKDQWDWLEQALARSTASVNIIVQGLQLHADRQGPVETWSRFPSSQHRLYQLLLKPNVRAPIVVSGDVHHAQLLRQDCQFVETNKEMRHTEPTRTLLEVTTSGMTHSWGSEICARPHQLFLCRMSYIKWTAGKAMQFAQWINGAKVWTELIDLSLPDAALHRTEEGGRPGMQFSLDRNYAEFEFDWDARAVIVRILGQEVGGLPLLSSQWSFDSLSGKVPHVQPALVKYNDYMDAYEELFRLGGFDNTTHNGQWICRNYRGTPSPAFRLIGVVLPLVFGLSMAFAPFAISLVGLLWLFKRIFRPVPPKAKQA